MNHTGELNAPYWCTSRNESSASNASASFVRGEVAAEALARLADGVREAVHDLAHARLAELLLAVEAGLAEVLGDDDVGRELRPAGRDLGALHLEDDRAVGVRDDAGAALPGDLIERVAPRWVKRRSKGTPLGGPRFASDWRPSRSPC